MESIMVTVQSYLNLTRKYRKEVEKREKRVRAYRSSADKKAIACFIGLILAFGVILSLGDGLRPAVPGICVIIFFACIVVAIKYKLIKWAFRNRWVLLSLASIGVICYNSDHLLFYEVDVRAPTIMTTSLPGPGHKIIVRSIPSSLREVISDVDSSLPAKEGKSRVVVSSKPLELFPREITVFSSPEIDIGNVANLSQSLAVLMQREAGNMSHSHIVTVSASAPVQAKFAQLGEKAERFWTMIRIKGEEKDEAIKNPRRLPVGAVLKIPVDPNNPEAGSVEYTVKKGDCLSRIAMNFWGGEGNTPTPNGGSIYAFIAQAGP